MQYFELFNDTIDLEFTLDLLLRFNHLRYLLIALDTRAKLARRKLHSDDQAAVLLHLLSLLAHVGLLSIDPEPLILSSHQVRAHEHVRPASDQEREYEHEKFGEQVVETANIGGPLHDTVVDTLDPIQRRGMLKGDSAVEEYLITLIG